MVRVPPQLSGFAWAYHPVALGSSPQHTIHLQSNSGYICLVKRTKINKKRPVFLSVMRGRVFLTEGMAPCFISCALHTAALLLELQEEQFQVADLVHFSHFLKRQFLQQKTNTFPSMQNELIVRQVDRSFVRTLNVVAKNA